LRDEKKITESLQVSQWFYIYLIWRWLEVSSSLVHR